MWHSEKITGAAEHAFACLNEPTCYLEAVTSRKRRGARQRKTMLLHLLGFAMLAGLAGLVAFEIVAEVRGAGETLHDRYHE